MSVEKPSTRTSISGKHMKWRVLGENSLNEEEIGMERHLQERVKSFSSYVTQ